MIDTRTVGLLSLPAPPSNTMALEMCLIGAVLHELRQKSGSSTAQVQISRKQDTFFHVVGGWFHRVALPKPIIKDFCRRSKGQILRAK